ncbi:hypothetical protein EGW08_005918 [Elysia chlorotica]|uniref:BEN domain-containing protein n=1 Tax=Elysia chlorotica TaxID=188477 RepID=A0A3S0ZTH7_ELYCH|nr:hypothetical protein EGW08_005918 [Elysia chlorotica]
MNGESANKFISALVKSLQTLCHGYVDFNDGIEIIGHLYLNIDSGSSFDYIVKEKVCKNAESGTIFVSKSFQAHSPPGEVISRKDKDDLFDDSSMSPTTGTHRIQSAISNISNVLSGQPGQKLHPSHHLSSNSGKRKRDHGGSYLQPGYKYTTLQTSSSSGYFSNASSSKQEDRNHSEHFNNSSHAEFFGGDSNQGSGMGADEEDDLDLDVTFVKEEYQRNSGQRVASRLSQDQGSSQSSVLHEGQLNYPPNHSQAPQQFASGTAGDLSGLSQNFQDPSQLELGQQPIQGPPNPRNNALAGPPPRMQDGVKPLCGYVHPDDAKKWMMFELVLGTGVYIHQENYNVVLSKMRQDRPDGKAMTRYLMSCFWRQSDLVGASIAEPPKPHQRSLDRGIVQAIIEFCTHHSRELPTDIRRTIQQKIGYARFYFIKKSQDPESPRTTPATISIDASPRRMSMEMARRESGSLVMDPPFKLNTGSGGKRGRRANSSLTRTLSESGDQTSRLNMRSPPDLVSRSYSELGDGPSRQGEDIAGGRLSSSSGDVSSNRLPTSMANRLPSDDINRRMPIDMASRIPNEFPARTAGDISGRISSDLQERLGDDLSTRAGTDLSPQSTEISNNRMPHEIPSRAGPESMSLRTSDATLSELASRMGSMPSGMSRGFLDMLNNFYPSN